MDGPFYKRYICNSYKYDLKKKKFTEVNKMMTAIWTKKKWDGKTVWFVYVLSQKQSENKKRCTKKAHHQSDNVNKLWKFAANDVCVCVRQKQHIMSIQKMHHSVNKMMRTSCDCVVNVTLSKLSYTSFLSLAYLFHFFFHLLRLFILRCESFGNLNICLHMCDLF